MIHDMKPYPVYKDSGVPWLGQVPEHWGVQRGKCLFNYRKEINVNRSNSNILSLTLRGVVNNNPDDPEGLVPKDYGSYQIFKKGDLVFKLIDLENLRTSRVGLVHEDGIMSPAYVRLTPQTIGDIRFFYHQYFDLYQRGIYNQLGAGVRSTLGPIDLLNLNILVPPLTEQSAIVRYLDYMDRRIRRYIHAKQKLIKLLEEQKQAIIHRAVTRGLDPDVKLKPSGVEWLGDVPEHWEVTVAKRISYVFIPQRDKPELNDTEGIPWVTLECIGDTFVKQTRFFVREQDARVAGSKTLPSGSIIASCVGRFGISSITTEPVIINQQIQAYIPRENIIPMFFRYYIQVSKTYFEMEGNSTTLAYVDRETFENMPIVLPPISEQRAIVELMSLKIDMLVDSIEQIQREIALLREYRTRLISDVVTGKLDVREAAASLPDEVEEPEVLEDEESTEVDPEGEPEENIGED